MVYYVNYCKGEHCSPVHFYWISRILFMNCLLMQKPWKNAGINFRDYCAMCEHAAPLPGKRKKPLSSGKRLLRSACYCQLFVKKVPHA